MCRYSDYRPRPELDRYDETMLDEEVYSDLSQGDRAAAEAEMRRRVRLTCSWKFL